MTASHGEMKREIAERIGTDPSRYGGGTDIERHKVIRLPDGREIWEGFER